MEGHLQEVAGAIRAQNANSLVVLLSFPYWKQEIIPLGVVRSYLSNRGNSEAKLQHLLNQLSVGSWNAFLVTHIHACLYYCGDQSLEDAVEYQTKASKEFLRFFTSESLTWAIPVFIQLIQQIRVVSQALDTKLGSTKTNLEACIITYREFFKAATIHSTALLPVIIANIRVYFMLHTYQKCNEMIRYVTSGKTPALDTQPISQRVTYSYYTGCVSIFELDIVNAAKKLSFAYDNCPQRAINNKRLILRMLIPLRLLQGIIPSKKLLAKYSLAVYGDVVDAFRRGDIALLRYSIRKNQQTFIQYGVYLILEKLQLLTFRNLLKRNYSILQGTPAKQLVTMERFYRAVKMMDKDFDMDLEEVECMVANLIYKKYIRGCIYKRSTSALKLAKTDPFPSLQEVFNKL